MGGATCSASSTSGAGERIELIRSVVSDRGGVHSGYKFCERGLTWIKPSFLWMMYRCGWATKAGQETVLAVEITRDGFEWVLRNACLSSYVRGVHPDRATWQRQLKSVPTRIQWDPERDLHLQPLPYRSLQLGLSGEAARRYADEWTVTIRDVTPLAHEIHTLVRSGNLDSAARLLPQERPYPAADELLPVARPALAGVN
ncbi:DUF4291 domain-containing protein [Streptomyces lunaelactis]|nr:DUF4291 domain-containing protein [Streptomyces lunaelactis]NUL08904.1 DUF4291 domain-containing protein [Streptomyces lunaelactis]